MFFKSKSGNKIDMVKPIPARSAALHICVKLVLLGSCASFNFMAIQHAPAIPMNFPNTRCLGGESVGAKNSPVKRLDAQGNQTNKGRQIDCFVPSNRTTYELKLRVTIAASGQGRFGEEMSFPVESQAAGFTPVLLVLDPTHSARLTELSNKYLECGGQFYLGEDAWSHMEEQAGDIVSVFIEKYIKPAIKNIEEVDISALQGINLTWDNDSVEISSNEKTYSIKRA